MPPKNKRPVNLDNVFSKYFRLKKQYEKSIQQGRAAIMNNTKLTDEQKTKQLQEYKPPCIKCKHASGSVFSENGRNFKVICGNTQQPCDLRIEMIIGKKQHIDDILTVAEDAVSEIKEKIIKLKLDVTYNYKTEQEVQIEFNQLKEEYNKFQLVLEQIINMKASFIDSKQRKEQIIELNNKMDGIIANFSNTANLYDELRDSSKITEIIQEYQDVLVPILNEIKQIKYRDEHVYKKKLYTDTETKESVWSYNLVQDTENWDSFYITPFDSEKSTVIAYDIK